MAFQDQYPSGSDLPRSLSDQLRILEQQLNRLSDNGPIQLVHPTREPLGLPTVLGRPIGLASPPRAPMLGAPEPYGDEQGAPAPQGTFRRRVTIAGVSLLLLSSTAVIPSLWHFAVPETSEEVAPAVVSLRTEQFAHTARELGQVQLVEPAPAEIAPASVPHTAAPQFREAPSLAAARPVATLTVAESDLARLSLPMLVSGGGRAWAGSAVVIDGLPAEARVSHGMKIAPDTWTVGIADVGHAVLSLPRTTPDRLELSVRVVAADSHELAASALRIQVLRSPDRAAQLVPAAVFEPTAAETGAGREIDPAPTSRQAVKVNRTKRPAVPASPMAPPPTQTAKQQEWPTATSPWVTEERRELPTFGFAPMPKWAPFSDR
ncbi:MAG: hypothetical protein J0I75_19520 [Hyphomicrobium sp.]|nr:hypothetical protein [Hyphomicrobium sp.]